MVKLLALTGLLALRGAIAVEKEVAIKAIAAIDELKADCTEASECAECLADVECTWPCALSCVLDTPEEYAGKVCTICLNYMGCEGCAYMCPHVVTDEPTPMPTMAPTTDAPTTPMPSANPTSEPTVAPTDVPVPAPTASPTPVPVPAPTPGPAPVPTPAPTAVPVPAPTEAPSTVPVPVPTHEPTVYSHPTPGPTSAPSAVPFPAPTAVPVPVPTAVPVPAPSAAPTAKPTDLPSPVPTPVPSAAPTALPTDTPTSAPTSAPTVTPAPTPKPTHMPTNSPEFLVIYSSDDTELYSYDMISGETEFLVSGTFTADLKVDQAAAKVFWSTVSGHIYTYDLAAGEANKVLDFGSEVMGLALDPSVGDVWFAAPKNYSVYTVNYDGTGLKRVVDLSGEGHGGIEPYGLDLSPAYQSALVSDPGLLFITGTDFVNGYIYQSSLTGSTIEQAYVTDYTQVRGIVVDINYERMYWIENREYAPGLYTADFAANKITYDKYAADGYWVAGIFDLSKLLVLDVKDEKLMAWTINKDNGQVSSSTTVAEPSSPRLIGYYWNNGVNVDHYSPMDDVTLAAADDDAADTDQSPAHDDDEASMAKLEADAASPSHGSGVAGMAVPAVAGVAVAVGAIIVYMRRPRADAYRRIAEDELSI